MENLRHIHTDMVAAYEAAKAIAAKAVSEKRSMTEDERAAWKSNQEKGDSLKDTYEAAKQSSAAIAAFEAPTRGIVSVHDNHQDEPFANLGEQLIAVARSSRPGARIDARLLGIMERAPLGSSEAVPADGGFLVQTDFSNALLAKAHEVGQLAAKVRKFPLGANANGIKFNVIDESSRVTGSRWGGVQTYWVAEAGTATAKKPKLRQIAMDLQKLMGLFYATDELLQDGAALSSIATQAFQEEFGFVFDDTIFRGTGVGQPLGFMAAPCLYTVAKEAGQAADTVVFENIVKMYAAMPARNKSNATWYINTNVVPQLLSLTMPLGGNAVAVYLPPGGISGQPYGTIFGRPVVEIEQAASIGDLGDITFADLSEYLWIEKGGVQAASSIHVQFLTDETTFRWVVRVNGQPSWSAPLTPYKGVASSLSPFVALAAR